MSQNLDVPVLDNGANEKRSVPLPVASDESSKEIVAVEETVSSLANKDAGVQSVPVTKVMRRKALIQFATLCWSIFVVGWNDGTTGPLVPRLQEVYHVCGISAHRCVGRRSSPNSYFVGIVRRRVSHFHRQLRCMYTMIRRVTLQVTNHWLKCSRASSLGPPHTSI